VRVEMLSARHAFKLGAEKQKAWGCLHHLVGEDDKGERQMKRTGILSIISSVAQLQGMRLARASAGDPLGAAVDFLANRGLDDGDFIWVTGTDGFINTLPVMFLAQAGRGFSNLSALTTAAGELASAASAAAEATSGGVLAVGVLKPATETQPAAGAKKKAAKKAAAKGSAKKSANKKPKKG
jgi:hypothetical protein